MVDINPQGASASAVASLGTGGAPKKCQRVCKPGSVPPFRGSATIPLGHGLLHGSSNQPGQRAGNIAPGLAPHAAPIRSCSRWGLPCRSCCQSRGALLPHPFTMASPKRSPSALCGTFPKAGKCSPALPDVIRHRVFRGARTFLAVQKSHPAAARPSGTPLLTRLRAVLATGARAGSCGTRHQSRRR